MSNVWNMPAAMAMLYPSRAAVRPGLNVLLQGWSTQHTPQIDTMTQTTYNNMMTYNQSSRLNNDATYHAYQKSCPLVGAVSQI